MVFYSASSKIDKVPTAKLSVEVYVFGERNVPHMDCLPYSDGIDTPDKLNNFPRH